MVLSMSPTTKSHLFFAAGQVILGICLVVCLYLIPRYFFSSDQGGVSNYGTEPETKWFYTAGFAAAALATFFTAIKLPSGNSRGVLRALLVLLSLLYAFVLLTTFSYKLSDSLGHLHNQSAFVLFGGMVVAAVWSLITVRDKKNRVAFTGLCAGVVLGILATTGILRMLFVAEILTGLAFAYLMAHTIAVLERR